MNLTQKILEDTSDTSRIDFEVLLMARTMIDKYRYGSVSETEDAVDKDFDQFPPTFRDIKQLKHNLSEFVMSSPHPLLLQQAISTLGRTGDKKIVKLLQPFLHAYLSQVFEANTVVYSTMVALDECGENIFSRNSFGLSDFDDNVSDARSYLKTVYGVDRNAEEMI